MELTLDQKIKYTGIIARILMFASFLFILFGASVKLMYDSLYGNLLMETGLAFVALFAVAIYVKRTLEKRIEAGMTFHQQVR